MRAAALLIASSAVAQPFTAEESQRLLAGLSAHEKLAAARPDLWPGLDPAAVPLAIYRPGGALVLAGHPAPPPGTALRMDGRPARLIAAAPADWSGGGPALLAGVRVARLDPAALDETEPAAWIAALASATFAAHRAARGAEGARLGRAPDPAALFDYPDDDPVVDASLELEAILLEQALRADPLAARDRLRELAALRLQRREQLPPPLRDFEDGVESADGLARYVEVRALRAAASAGLVAPGAAEAAVAARLARGSAGAADRIGRAAARAALILDGVAPAWRAAVDGGQTLDAALARAGGGAPGAAKAARARLGFAALLEESRKRVREEWRRRELAWGHVEAAGGIGVVAVDAAPFGAMGVQRVDFVSARRVDGQRRLHERLRVELGPGAAAALLEYQVPVAEDRGRGRYAARLPRDARIIADGRELRLDLSSTTLFLDAEVVGTGLHLRVHGGLLHVENGGARVRPFPRAAPASAAR